MYNMCAYIYIYIYIHTHHAPPCSKSAGPIPSSPCPPDYLCHAKTHTQAHIQITCTSQ